LNTIRFLDLRKQYESIKADIDAAITQTLESCHFIGGPAVANFEKEFAVFQRARHCIGMGNGTDAIEITLAALGLERGAEVLVPANSFIASSEAVTTAGLKVIFCAVDQATGLLDLTDARAKITRKTKVILPVHLYGQPCNMDAIMSLAQEFELQIIEDCAQAHGAEWKGRRVGTFGICGTFSFYPGKNLGAYGDGGAVITNDDALANRIRMIANHGRTDKYNHEFEGRNSRLDALQAAILSVKLKYLEAWTNRRVDIAEIYSRELSGIADLKLPVTTVGARHVFHLFVVRTSQRNELQSHLRQAGIETGIHYPIALTRLNAYQSVNQTTASDDLNEQVLSLPIGEHLTAHEVGYVITTIKNFFKSTSGIQR
jgi:dTDP-4-amino-4,6-dideoxygalactose transaminase